VHLSLPRPVPPQVGVFVGGSQFADLFATVFNLTVHRQNHFYCDHGQENNIPLFAQEYLAHWPHRNFEEQDNIENKQQNQNCHHSRIVMHREHLAPQEVAELPQELVAPSGVE
jgi:hypothetical protein